MIYLPTFDDVRLTLALKEDKMPVKTIAEKLELDTATVKMIIEEGGHGQLGCFTLAAKD